MPQFSDHNVTFKEGDKVIMFDADAHDELPKAQQPVYDTPEYYAFYKESTVIKMYQDKDSEWRCDVKFGDRLSKRHYCSCAKNI